MIVQQRQFFFARLTNQAFPGGSSIFLRDSITVDSLSTLRYVISFISSYIPTFVQLYRKLLDESLVIRKTMPVQFEQVT